MDRRQRPCITKFWDAAAARRGYRVEIPFARAEDRAWLGWWEGEDDFRVVPTLLLDIIRGGAAILTDALPPEGDSVWVCLEGTLPDQYARAVITEVAQTPQGPHKARLVFSSPCPPGFFEASVHGFPVPEVDSRLPEDRA